MRPPRRLVGGSLASSTRTRGGLFAPQLASRHAGKPESVAQGSPAAILLPPARLSVFWRRRWPAKSGRSPAWPACQLEVPSAAPSGRRKTPPTSSAPSAVSRTAVERKRSGRVAVARAAIWRNLTRHWRHAKRARVIGASPAKVDCFGAVPGPAPAASRWSMANGANMTPPLRGSVWSRSKGKLCDSLPTRPSVAGESVAASGQHKVAH